MFRYLLVVFCCFTLTFLEGCSNPSNPVNTANQTVTLKDARVNVGCGMCIYKLAGSKGCYWAAEIDGNIYLVQGNTPKNHENHSPEGMCNMTRVAIIDGTLQHGQLNAQKFELVPPADVPASPNYTLEDIH
jgi:hypothetical protein